MRSNKLMWYSIYFEVEVWAAEVLIASQYFVLEGASDSWENAGRMARQTLLEKPALKEFISDPHAPGLVVSDLSFEVDVIAARRVEYRTFSCARSFVSPTPIKTLAELEEHFQGACGPERV